jgi:Ca2+-binding RTX toxin-like protein
MDGQFAAAWATGIGGTSAVYLQLFDEAHPVQTLSIGGFTSPAQWFISQSPPSVAALPGDRFAVTWGWGDISGDVFSNSFIFTETFDGNGVQRSSSTNSVLRHPVAAPYLTASPLSNGGFVETWVQGAFDNTPVKLQAEIFNAFGTPIGGTIVNSTPLGTDWTSSSAAGLPDGHFIVTWQSNDGSDGDGTLIRARLFDASGAPAGNDFVVNSTSAGYQYNPTVAALPNGHFVVTWQSDDGGDGDGLLIRARLFDASGAPAGNDFVVNTASAGSQFSSSVAALPDGHFAVGWLSDDQGFPAIHARLFEASGTPIGNDFIIDGPVSSNPTVFAQQDGHFLITWNGGGSFHALVLSPSGIGVTLNGTNEGDVISGSPFADQLYGLGGDDTIRSGDGADMLLGGVGADTMFGGPGDDGYVVDNSSDSVIENANEGSDAVYASVHYRLPTNVEYLVLQGTADLQGYGNSLANALTGNTGNNILDGGTGGDAMYGGAGNDAYFVDDAGDVVIENAGEGSDTVYATVHYHLPANVEYLVLQGSADLQGYGNSLANVISGNAGSNVLNGDAGADAMYGGAGNDAYFVDNAGDIVIENANEGIDMLFASVDFNLPMNVEYLVLQGNADLQAYGNSQANNLYGNAGNNILNGQAGADVMAGGAGNDTYFVDNGLDKVVEGANEGTDAIFSTVHFILPANVETLVLQGSADANGTGNTLTNKIYGNSGNNVLDGQGGADILVGGAGNDTFVFHAGQADGDMVVDFAGNGVAAGDSLALIGYGTDATFSQSDARHWQVSYNGGASHDVITFSNAASIDTGDFVFM